ncbi:diacylglycerol kinase family enzyme [Lewinella marina]|uniref:DAGKc domain-containing protein n=1 Tax=Neolewinella marina TaxID=438751 RepID=A0A2G0CG92_9BACT|nr:diacylglycerol kinase family protein [Neolewinella marina]NJB86553.1 diacylglycerol kinase family enzyme [Neolewinella marina]PHK98993.1 hypothetical protein CGL56_05905 [Neolewinella marina]
MISAPHFIVNPAAAGGRAARWWRYAWPVLLKRLPKATFSVADRQHSLADRLESAVGAVHREIVGVGGDGTHHDLVNAAVNRGLTQACTYTPLPLGSGNDWCRSLGVPRHILQWLQMVEEDRTILHRIGQLAYGDGNLRYFVNAAGLAYDAEVVRRSATAGYKHRLLYPFLTALHLPTYRPPALTLTYDGTRVAGQFHTIGFGMGRCKGGGMRVLPHAEPTADTLALTYAVDVPLHRIAANGWRLYTGSIGQVPGVTTTHASVITVEGTTGLEADGEYLGSSPVRAELTKARLKVRCGA